MEVRFQNLCELIDKERKVAKELVVMGKRDRALLALKRAKLQDSSKESCEKWIYKVDEMVRYRYRALFSLPIDERAVMLVK